MDFLFGNKDTRRFDFPLHDHGYWEIILGLEGHGVLLADGVTYDFHPGMIACIRPGVLHTRTSPGGYIDGAVLTRDFCFQHLPDPVLFFHDDANQSFLALYRLGQRYADDPNPDSPATRFRRSILAAMQNLLRHWRAEAGMPAELAAFQNLLHANIANPQFDILQAITSTGYSPSHFRRLFKEQFGASPVQYFKQLKIQVAKEELLGHHRTLSIAQVAANCGFRDPDYFARVFRQVTGMSPTQFYQQSRQGLDGNKMIAKSE